MYLITHYQEIIGMDFTIQELKRALELIGAPFWSSTYPKTHARHHLVVNALLNQEPNLFSNDPVVLQSKLMEEQNRWIREILNETSLETFAFAVRAALY